MLSSEDISFFLRCGFLPYPTENAIETLFCNNDIKNFADKLPNEDEKKLVEQGISALEACFRDVGTGIMFCL